MGDWEDEGFELQLPPTVALPDPPPREGWEHEVDKALVEPEAPAALAAAGGPAKPEQVKAKHLAKERQRRAEEERDADRARALDDEGPSDPALRKQWLEERTQAADLAAAADALGLGAKAAPLAPGADIGACVEAMPLTDAASFRDAGARVAARVCRDGVTVGLRASSDKAAGFFREALKAAADKLSVDDLKALTDLLDVVRNKKLQDAKGKKKGAAGKPKAGKSLMMERDGDFGDYADDDYKASAPAPAAAPAAAAAAAAAPAVDAAAGEKSWRVVEDFM